MEKKKRVIIIVSGKVQGVFFRLATKKTAESLNISGYVKNLENGDVEAVAEGNENDLMEFIEFCKKGPSSAKVDSVRIDEIKKEKKFNDFSIHH